MDEDDESAALAHQQELELQERMQRCRQLTKELNDETKLFNESTRTFWDNLKRYEQERYDDAYHGKRNRR